MDRKHRLFILPLVILFVVNVPRAVGEAGAPPQATVKNETLPVYAQMSPTSRIVKTLKPGDKVSVEFDILSAGQQWCAVREEGRARATGYVLCKGLERPVAAAEKEWSRLVPPGPPVPPAAPPGAKESKPQTKMSGREFGHWLVNSYNPDFWQDRLNFTPPQREAARSLAASTGMSRCVADMAKIYRRYGIFDLMSLAMSSEEFQREIKPAQNRCVPHFKEFWTQFPNLLSPEQREKFLEEQATLGRSSNPEAALPFYALSQASR